MIEKTRDQLIARALHKDIEIKNRAEDQSRLQKQVEELRDALATMKLKVEKYEAEEPERDETDKYRQSQIENLEKDKKNLREELEATRAVMLASDNSLIVSLAQLRIDLEGQKAENARLTQMLEYADRDREYAKEAYRQANIQGGERAREAEELRNENDILQRKADDRPLQLRALQNGLEIQQKDQEIELLKGQFEDAQERLRRLEAKEFNNGGPNSRGGKFGGRGGSKSDSPGALAAKGRRGGRG